MPWMETCPVEQRAKFIFDVEEGFFSITELCRSYGVSRKTAYKWLARYDSEGLDGLKDRSRARHTQPDAVPDAVRRLIIDARRAHPSWGPKKLRPWLARRHAEVQLPSLTTIHTILKGAKLVKPARCRRRPDPGISGPLHGDDRPNGVWCIDFKGQFRLGDGQRCYPLTVSDGCSRMLLACRGGPGVQWRPVQRTMIALFRTYGVPEAIRSDNGVPFASSGIARLSRLSVWWLDQGIRLQRIEPGRPQQNGRHERIHRTLKAETTRPPSRSPRAQQHRFNRFMDEYNWERPHEALGQRCPGEVYEPSPRPFLPDGQPYAYPSHYEQRHVHPNGEITWRRHRTFLSEALAGRRVGLVELEEDLWKVFYRDLALGVLDTQMRPMRIHRIPAGRPHAVVD